MNNLFTYISAMKDESPSGLIAEKVLSEQSFEEDGVLTESSELIVTFTNGVSVKQSVEFEHGEVTSGTVCTECWISYEVVAEPKGLYVKPKRKDFINKCQESFWLKINQVQTSA